jgi:hypothetical protein
MSPREGIMLVAALDLPFSDEFRDTERFIARVESEVMSKEFDVLVLPAQPYERSSRLPPSPAQRESHTRGFVNWMCEISRRKHALVVCGTREWRTESLFELVNKSVFYRTALASYDGHLLARHVLWPESVAKKRSYSMCKFSTPVATPMCTAAILLGADLVRPLSLAALCLNETSMCLVSGLISNENLVNSARDVAARFGLFVVLAGYRDQCPDEPSNGSSVIISPTGKVIVGGIGNCGLLLTEVPDVHAWTNTIERDIHKWSIMVDRSEELRLIPNDRREYNRFYPT